MYNVSNYPVKKKLCLVFSFIHKYIPKTWFFSTPVLTQINQMLVKSCISSQSKPECVIFESFSFTCELAGDAGPVCPGQQSRCPNAAEAGGADGPQSKSHTGQWWNIKYDPTTGKRKGLKLIKLCWVNMHKTKRKTYILALNILFAFKYQMAE